MRLLLALSLFLLLSHETGANPSQRVTDLLEQVETIRGANQVEEATGSCDEA